MSAINDRKTAGLECSFCTPVSRRDFVRTIGAGALASAVPIIGQSATAAGPVQAGPTPKSIRRDRCRSLLQDDDAGATQTACFSVRRPTAEAGGEQLGDREAVDR